MAEPQNPDMIEQQAAGRGPIEETPDFISYHGVRLEKSKRPESPFVPRREQFRDFINDQFALELQRDIAVAFAQGQPVLIEGGTSIGKTRTVRKMAADLGWEVHYINLHGLTDVEDLMGRYASNTDRKSPQDPEFVFKEGEATQGLKQEEGKIKVIILDEIDFAATNVLNRAHEILDALETGGSVVLTENASERVITNKSKTKIVALMNPPGKGYIGREPLDRAQLRRWVYLKAPSELPAESFSQRVDAMFNLAPRIKIEPMVDIEEQTLLFEQLPETPGLAEIVAKYREFHQAAKKMVQERKVGADQPQQFSFDDMMEPRRVRDYVLRFYNGDITETFQQALRYYYSNKLESPEDRNSLDELIETVEYIPSEDVSRRLGPDRESIQRLTLLNGAEINYKPKPLVLGNGTQIVPQQEYVKDGKNLIYLGIDPQTGKTVSVPSELILQKEAQQNEGEQKAEGIFGKDFLGVEAIRLMEEKCKAAGINVEFDTRGIEFKYDKAKIKEAKEDARRGRERMIVLRPINMKVNGKHMPITIKNLRDLFKEVNPFGTGKIFYDQEWYDSGQDFADLPLEGRFALPTKNILANSTDTTWNDQEKLLENGETRREAVETVWDLILYYAATGEKLLQDKYDWTSSRASGGSRVRVGGFDEKGLFVSSWPPDVPRPRIGVAPQK